MQIRRALFATSLLVTFTACASIVVHKIPLDGGDDVEGFRYYLPRPYIAVTSEFPYASSDAYVSGTVVGNYLQLDQATLQRLKLDADGDVPTNLPVSSLLHAESKSRLTAEDSNGGKGGGGKGVGGGKGTGGSATGAGGTGGGGADTSTGGKDGKSGGKDTSPGDGGVGGASPSLAQASGVSNGLVVIPNSPFDIVYLPDFEQQYAIEPGAGMSVNELKLTLGNGWMLESLDAKIDNSAIGNFLMSQAGKTLDLLRSMGGLAAGLPTTGLQAEVQGESVLVRVRTILYATPGIYPVLKPRELASCAASLCAGVVKFNTRKERFFEVVQLGGGPSDAAGGGPDPEAKRVVDDVVAKLRLPTIVASVDKVPGSTKKIITLDRPTNGASTEQIVTQLISALKKVPGFGSISSDWIKWK
ncbi:MAG TPA: hypothetical protein VHC69_10045 [Polyangiaceae bacterium]|nr:hypothetical protein [Polyangiaceae bacterium]